MAPSWAIPVGVLSGIVVAGLIAIWFWFPRAWQKGVNSDSADTEATLTSLGYNREAQRHYNRAIIKRFAKARARERGEEVSDDEEGIEMAIQPPPPPYSNPPTSTTGVTAPRPAGGA